MRGYPSAQSFLSVCAFSLLTVIRLRILSVHTHWGTDMNTYTRKIELPANKREGLANFVQMIVNNIEAGEIENALLTAVDLHQDIETGIHDDAMVNTTAEQAFVRELQAKYTADIIAAAQKGHEDGIRAEKARMASALGLVSP
ncbi:hypothetical protein NKH73_14005 [Mesorhizobium sp. M0938]|uniref:hypothetical protein n=1 Tax=unclassified Mesorhizobium TaxID=325217 RepID=UPI003338AD61